MRSGPVLIVEDEPHLRAIYRTTLEHEGFQVIEAADGQEALSRLLRPDGGEIQLVVSDVMMPKLGGRELLWRATEFFPDLPIVLLSGMVTEDSAHTGMNSRARVFLRKPVEPRDLARTVRELLAGDDAPASIESES